MEQVIRRARACVGVRFRPHGRNPRFGLDCVGLAGIAFGIAELPCGYPLRGGDPAAVAALIDAAGLVRTARTEPGALVLTDEGAGQLHLGVLVPDGFVHAHAGLRRVVEQPGVPAGRILGCWRERG